MEMAPRLELWPGLCLTLVVHSLNMFGDAVRDLLDPRLRGGGGRLGAGRTGSDGSTSTPSTVNYDRKQNGFRAHGESASSRVAGWAGARRRPDKSTNISRPTT